MTYSLPVRDPANRSHPQPPVLLFLDVLDFDGSYNGFLWKAVESRVRDRGLSLVTCLGRHLDASDPGSRPHNYLYHLALDRPFSGLVLTHLVFLMLDETSRRDWARRLAGRPVSATMVVDGFFPGIGCRNDGGFRQLVRHLVADHARRRILFVTGTPGLEVSGDRQRLWEEEMKAAGLPHGPEWVVRGHFNPRQCPGVVSEVFRKARELGADAVVTSGDLVAASLVRELPALGIRVPEDLAVTGFDDLPLAADQFPALTTVHQPLGELFRAAVDLALDGGPQSRFLEGHRVVRESCGCPSPEIGSGTNGSGRVLLAEAREQNRSLRVQVSELNGFAGQVGALAGPEGLEALFNHWMPRLGVGDYALSLSCDAEGILLPLQPADGEIPGTGTPAWHRAWAQGPQMVCGPDQNLVYPARDLAHPSWWESGDRTAVVALPLVGNCHWHGLLVVDAAPGGISVCRAVQELTASFLDRYFQLKEEVRLHHESRLRAQVEAEKTRTLGHLLAGFSHDLATPFSVGRDSASLLLESLEALNGALAGRTLTKNFLQAFINDSMTLARLLETNWSRANDLVDRFKRVGTEIPRDSLRRVDLARFLGDIVQTLEPMWRHKNVEVILEVHPPLEVQTRTAAFVDIISNLVQNAVVHGFPGGGGGKIWVGAKIQGDLCLLEVSDNGVGVPEDLREQIFTPFMTTKEDAGGTGLGLAIVRDRVQGLLGGTVTCRPRAGGGTLFLAEFPRILTE